MTMRLTASTPVVRILCGALLAAIAARAPAVDGVFASVGGDRPTTVYTVGLSWAAWATWPLDPGWSLSLRGTGDLSWWHARNAAANSNADVVVIGAYPVLRLDMTAFAGFVPYAEGSIGVNLLSRTSFENRRLSTAFQFGEFFGVGGTFGDKRQFDIGARYQHISNADIKKPNDGLTYPSIVFQYRFGSP
jgi:lipid A 3-O-deacylase